MRLSRGRRVNLNTGLVISASMTTVMNQLSPVPLKKKKLISEN
ncbi:hypothetical protein VP142E351_P0010 [Vibrio phage 142E35-1]|nr:hypothetical protein VP142E351_P0010 [Vibrio phage 142E35-1]